MKSNAKGTMWAIFPYFDNPLCCVYSQRELTVRMRLSIGQKIWRIVIEPISDRISSFFTTKGDFAEASSAHSSRAGEILSCKLPIIVNDNGDVLVFTTVSKAERYLEPIDVQNGEYDAVFDADGVVLTQSVVKNQKGREQVVLNITEPKQQQVEKLRGILIKFLSQVLDPPQPVESLSLQQLVEMSLQFKTE